KIYSSEIDLADSHFFEGGAMRRNSSKKLKMKVTLSSFCSPGWSMATATASRSPSGCRSNSRSLGRGRTGCSDQSRGLSALNESAFDDIRNNHNPLIKSTIKKLVARSRPGGLEASSCRHLPFAPRTGKGPHENFISAGFVRLISDPSPIRRKHRF